MNAHARVMAVMSRHVLPSRCTLRRSPYCDPAPICNPASSNRTPWKVVVILPFRNPTHCSVSPPLRYVSRANASILSRRRRTTFTRTLRNRSPPSGVKTGSKASQGQDRRENGSGFFLRRLSTRHRRLSSEWRSTARKFITPRFQRQLGSCSRSHCYSGPLLLPMPRLFNGTSKARLTDSGRQLRRAVQCCWIGPSTRTSSRCACSGWGRPCRSTLARRVCRTGSRRFATGQTATRICCCRPRRSSAACRPPADRWCPTCRTRRSCISKATAPRRISKARLWRLLSRLPCCSSAPGAWR